MKRILILFTLIVSLASCEKVQTTKLYGEWSESYDDINYCIDGSAVYSFNGNNMYHLHIYDALSGNDTLINNQFLLEGNRLTLNPQMSDNSCVIYDILLLNDNEMAWQKVGTTFSKGTYGSDYKHFVRRNSTNSLK